MCQFICYHICQVSVSEALTSDNDSFESFFNKNNFNAEIFVKIDKDRELNLQSLIETVESDNILKIWKIF